MTGTQSHTRNVTQQPQNTGIQCPLLGLDPGRTNIYFVVEELADGTFKFYKLTRAQYYQESGINQANA